MPLRRHRNVSTVACAFLLSLHLLAACASPAEMQPFSTDGCSLFPDRALVGKSDWCKCCLAHDLAYWRGGTAEERLDADRKLRACVSQASGDIALADLMYAGVRAGGGPYYLTPYRWGYGWHFGRSYRALSPEEEATASSLAREYLAKNPSLACPSDAPAQK